MEEVSFPVRRNVLFLLEGQDPKPLNLLFSYFPRRRQLLLSASLDEAIERLGLDSSTEYRLCFVDAVTGLDCFVGNYPFFHNVFVEQSRF
jgi:hypothetical protein